MPMINNVISTTPDYLQGYVGGYPVNIPVGLLIPAVVQKGVVNGNQPVSYNPSTGIFSAAGATVSVSGTAPVLRIGATTAIPLDTANNGKAMPLVAGQTISITADITPTIAAGAILNGVCVADYLSTGTGNLILTSFNARGDTFAAENGRLFTVTYFQQTSGAFAVVQKGNLLDVIAPTLVSASVASATPTRVDLVFSEAMNSAWSVFGAFVVTGHTVSGITQLTTTTGYLTVQAFAYGEAVQTLSYTQPGTYNMQDVAGNLLANVTALAITNNVASAPGQVTALTLGTATSTTQPLTWTAPASNGGSALTDYLIEYKLAGAATYTAFAHSASTVTAIVVTGLTASNSYNYRVSAVNAIGTGAASAVGTGSTAAASTIAITSQTLIQPVSTGAQTYWSRSYQNNSYTGGGVAFGATAVNSDVFNLTNMVEGTNNITIGGGTQVSYPFNAISQASVQRALSHVASSGNGGRVRIWLSAGTTETSTQGSAHKPRLTASFADASASQFLEMDFTSVPAFTFVTYMFDIVFQSGAPTVMNFGYEDPAPGFGQMAFFAMAYYPA